MLRHIVSPLAAVLFLSSPNLVSGQVGPGPVDGRLKADDSTQQAPVDTGTSVQTEREGTIVWRASDGPFSLKTLVDYVAPVLWFSPDEPLIRSGRKLPQLLPGTTKKNDHAVYYNVPRLLIRDNEACAPFHREQKLVETLRLSWVDSDGKAETSAPPLGCLQEVKVRFFFYYESEVGVAAHLNDFESLQVNVAIEKNDQLPDGSFRCVVNTGAYCAVVTGAFGSAHGIAWYTNGLNVGSNRDTLLPLAVLVEEGKHASAPDRNRDGVYTPGFDVDIHPNDAWGIRDVLRTRWLQGPGYRADMSKVRVPRDRVFPRLPNSRLWKSWSAREPDIKLDPVYDLIYMHDASIDDSNKAATKYCKADSDRPAPPVTSELKCPKGVKCKPLADLIRDQEGCRRPRVLTYGPVLRLRAFFARVKAGGTHDEYLTWPRFFGERVVAGYRMSGASRSVWWIPPVALNVPGLDGWVSARLAFRQKTANDRPTEGAIDVLYSLSASRYFSLYTAVGRDTLPAMDSSDPNEHRVALEAGFKWRFSPPKFPVFSGVRVGIRANDPSNFRYPRMIVEIGGGSW